MGVGPRLIGEQRRERNAVVVMVPIPNVQCRQLHVIVQQCFRGKISHVLGQNVTTNAVRKAMQIRVPYDFTAVDVEGVVGRDVPVGVPAVRGHVRLRLLHPSLDRGRLVKIFLGRKGFEQFTNSFSLFDRFVQFVGFGHV